MALVIGFGVAAVVCFVASAVLIVRWHRSAREEK